MPQLTTQDVLRLPEPELVAALKAMSVEQLEQHAEGVISELGSDDYSGIMKIVMKALESQPTQTNRFTQIQNILRDTLPNKGHMSDIYQRLASMIMLILMRKYKDILTGK